MNIKPVLSFEKTLANDLNKSASLLPASKLISSFEKFKILYFSKDNACFVKVNKYLYL